MISLKRIKIPVLIFAIVSLAACKSNNNASEPRNIQLLNDTSTFHNNASSDTSKMVQTKVIQRKENVERVHSNTTESKNPENTGNSGSGTVSKGTSGSSTTTNGTVSNTGSGTSQTVHKKGWSKAAQGAAIGGVGGAIGGAIISKKKGAGAVVGGVIGAAGGYIIGHEKDKKDGRAK